MMKYQEIMDLFQDNNSVMEIEAEDGILDIKNCEVLSDYSFLKKLTNLKELHLRNCDDLDSVDLENISRLDSLEVLSLINSGYIESFSPLASLKKLKILDISGHLPVLDLRPLADLMVHNHLQIRGYDYHYLSNQEAIPPGGNYQYRTVHLLNREKLNEIEMNFVDRLKVGMGDYRRNLILSDGYSDEYVIIGNELLLSFNGETVSIDLLPFEEPVLLEVVDIEEEDFGLELIINGQIIVVLGSSGFKVLMAKYPDLYRNIQFLYIYDENMKSFDFLSGLNQLKFLHLASDQTEPVDLSQFPALTTLEQLILIGCFDKKTISVIEKLDRLKKFILSM